MAVSRRFSKVLPRAASSSARSSSSVRMSTGCSGTAGGRTGFLWGGADSPPPPHPRENRCDGRGGFGRGGGGARVRGGRREGRGVLGGDPGGAGGHPRLSQPDQQVVADLEVAGDRGRRDVAGAQVSPPVGQQDRKIIHGRWRRGDSCSTPDAALRHASQNGIVPGCWSAMRASVPVYCLVVGRVGLEPTTQGL